MLIFYAIFSNACAENHNSLSQKKSTSSRNEIYERITKKSWDLENKLLLAEYIKEPTWEDKKAHKEMGVPLPLYVGEKFTKMIYSPSLKYETDDKKHIVLAGLMLSQMKSKDVEYTLFEEVSLTYKKRIETYIKNTWMLYTGVEARHLKKYIPSEISDSQEKEVFEHYTQLGIFASNHFYLDAFFPQFYMQFDAGARKDKYFQEAYAYSYISKSIYDNLSFIAIGEAAVTYSGTLKNHVLKNFERYGTWNLNLGLKIFYENDEFFTFLFFYENDKRYAFKASGLVFSYTKKI